MTHDPRLDGRTVDWLCQGPERAPGWVLDAVDAHARAHPRHRFDPGRPGRSLVNQLQSTRPAAVFRDRVAPAWSGLAVTAVAVVLLVAGFAAGAALRSDGPAAPAAAGTSPAAPTPVAVPLVLTATCTQAAPFRDASTGDVSRLRDGRLECEVVAGDARLAGDLTVDLAMDRRPDGTGDAWGVLAVRTAQGRWSGPYSASIDAAGTQHLTGVLLGSGTYRELRVLLTGTATLDGYDLSGTLERAATPAAHGEVVVRQVTCLQGGDAGTESMDPSGVNHVQGRSMTCTAVSSDPRLAGDLTLVTSIEEQADQRARIWGSESLANDGGAWIGTWSGTYDTGWTTHRWAGVLAGSSTYDGLEYRFTTIGEWPRFVQVGLIAGS